MLSGTICCHLPGVRGFGDQCIIVGCSHLTKTEEGYFRLWRSTSAKHQAEGRGLEKSQIKNILLVYRVRYMWLQTYVGCSISRLVVSGDFRYMMWFWSQLRACYSSQHLCTLVVVLCFLDFSHPPSLRHVMWSTSLLVRCYWWGLFAWQQVYWWLTAPLWEYEKILLWIFWVHCLTFDSLFKCYRSLSEAISPMWGDLAIRSS